MGHERSVAVRHPQPGGETTSHKVIFWDFDGTLAERPGRWSTILWSILQEHEPTTPITPKDLGPILRTGYPWHTPDVPHPHLSDPL